MSLIFYRQTDRISVASVFGPITYMPSPVLVFREYRAPGDSEEDPLRRELVATGSLGSVDPDRIMLKKVILTGLPIRVRKRSAVLRHLFYDPQDVRWFKPAELTTKMGLRGHIREPVGTHGLLKASFSGPIKQNDTVMLVLYKRVFPKFPDQGRVVCK
jgi:pre-rRNA-processing protein TSR1